MDLVSVTLENQNSIVPVTVKVFTIGRAVSHELAIKVFNDKCSIQVSPRTMLTFNNVQEAELSFETLTL
jgi:hypothetical protein